MKLSEFKDERGVEVVAQLLIPISKIVTNEKNSAARESAQKNGASLLEFAAALLQNSPRDVMDMLAVLDGKDPADYHCSAATILMDVFNMIADPELLTLFGLQRQTPASSGSASENIEAAAELQGSSGTPAPNRNRHKKKRRSGSM